MPHSTVLHLNDPLEHGKAVYNGDLKLLATEGGDYEAGLTRIGVHGLFMQGGVQSLPIVVDGALDPKRRPIVFLADENQGEIWQDGRRLMSSDIAFLSPGAQFRQRIAGGSRWAAMSLTAEDLVQAGHAIAGRELVAPAVTRLLRVPSRPMARLRALHRAAGTLADKAPDVLAHPEVSRSLEQELVHAMVRCLSEGSVTTSDRVTHRRITVMRRFEQVLQASENVPLYMAEICAAIGVPERTLRVYCMEHLGMSPHRYLWLRRMHQARRALSLAEPGSTTVTSVATDQGFWELGRFAGEYFGLFGERPSVTLRRAPDYPAGKGIYAAFAAASADLA